MDDFFVDVNFIKQSLETFSVHELADYELYLCRLLRDGRLMEEDAMEAAFNRVVNERCGNGRK
jgi:hypothetical protein